MNMRSELIPRPVKILSVRKESHDMYTFMLGERMAHKPGQFIQVSVLGVGESPISISSYSEEHIAISVRVVGNVTHALARLKAGDAVHIRGPYGNGYPLEEHRGKHLVLVGGGCGVAPLKGAIDYLGKHHAEYGDIHLYLGFHSPDDVIFREEINAWNAAYNVTVTVSNVPEETCYTAAVGRVTDHLKALVIPEPLNTAVILCGPPKMMKDSIDILMGKGVSPSSMFLSTERLMYCAIGHCCHCMVRGKFVCTDGPVFSYEEIAHCAND